MKPPIRGYPRKTTASPLAVAGLGALVVLAPTLVQIDRAAILEQQGNDAALNDFLRRQALGEQAVYAPFGGLAQGGLGSTTSSTGK